MKRILTIQIEIEDMKEAAWIWQCHLDNHARNGIGVQAIYEGPIKHLLEEEKDIDE